jgi:translocation and assembly module TamA
MSRPPLALLPRMLLCAMLLLAAAPLRAGIRVDIEGVEGDAKRNVLAYLSVERYKDRDKLEEDTVVRLYNRIDDEVRSALKPLGYYEPKVETTYESSRNDSDWRIRITIEPGKPVIVESAELVIEGPGATDAAFDRVHELNALRKGVRLNHGSYEQAKGDLQRIAASYGYLDARLTENELKVDPLAHRADIRLKLSTGERYHFGEIRIEQSVIRPELMRRFMRFKEGDPYSTGQLLRTQFALDDSLYFSTVEVLPLERDAQTLSVPVRISAEKSKRQFSIGPGYGTDTGIRGTFGWSDARLNDRGHRFRLDVKASTITRRVDSRYDIPIGDPALEKFSMQLTNKTEQISDLNTYELSFTPSITQVLGPWQRVISVALTNTTTKSAADIETLQNGGVQRETSNLIVPGISFTSVPEGYLGEALFSRGFYAELIGSTRVLGSTSDFLRLHLQSERVFDFRDRWHVLLRGELGASLTHNFESLPGIYRFFAGGDRSVRGFAYNALSPKQGVQIIQRDKKGLPVLATDGVTPLLEPKQINVGGRHLLVGTAELVRDLPRNFAVATFFDVGNAFNRFGDPLAYSAGVGLRYRLPVVSIGLDIAQPLSESGSPRLHLNISPKL